MKTHIVTYYDEADCPEDGGKHALYCVHDDNTFVLQDTNKSRLMGWLNSTIEWCEGCQQDEATQ